MWWHQCKCNFTYLSHVSFFANCSSQSGLSISARKDQSQIIKNYLCKDELRRFSTLPFEFPVRFFSLSFSWGMKVKTAVLTYWAFKTTPSHFNFSLSLCCIQIFFTILTLKHFHCRSSSSLLFVATLHYHHNGDWSRRWNSIQSVRIWY